MLRSLEVELPLLYTQTKHLAMHVAAGSDSEPRVPNLIESGNRDLIVYLTEEAELGVLELEPMPKFLDDIDAFTCKVNIGPRGVRATDARGELDSRRCAELMKTVARVRHQDSRIWSSLQRRYTLAEQAATDGFRNTVIFEPFAGSFGVTKMASKRYGWTNSQPLDRIDGYDLLSGPGRSMVLKTLQQHRPFLVVLAFDCRIWTVMTNMNPDVDWETARQKIGLPTLRIVVLICKIQHEAGRFYLVENPVGSKAWTFHDILLRLLTDHGGKFVIGDQCAYGARDQETNRPIRKTTGYVTNSDAVANAVGRRCTCPHGAHQAVISQNRFGQRSKQAAQYPEGLCRANCDGVMHEMKICYIVQQASGGHFAFPVDDADDEVVDADQQQQWLQIAQSLAVEDRWEVQDHQLIRHHGTPRQNLFIPLSDSEPPVHLSRILPERTTEFTFLDGSRDALEDNWVLDGAVEMTLYWTGRTIFQLASQSASEPPLLQELELDSQQPMEEVPVGHGGGQGHGQGRNAGVLRRRRARTRQLQRGLWTLCEQDEELKMMMDNTLKEHQDSGGSGWSILDISSDLGAQWCHRESAQTSVKLIMTSTTARRMKKPQPHMSPADVPLRRTYLLMGSQDILSTGWEEWTKSSPTSQMRPLPNQTRLLCITLFGAQVDAISEPPSDREEHGPSRPSDVKEADREAKWNALPRELKLAISRIHQNLGHARVPDMLRALRISRASETAIKACRLFRCKECPRLLEPKIPRPSKLPQVDEFNVQIGMDVLEEKDSDNQSWSWLNIVCQGTAFQVCALLGKTVKNPTAAQVLEAFETGWGNWAGLPKHGLIGDRARYFLGSLADHLTQEGCHFTAAAKASPWQLGMIERAGGSWKSMFRRLVWSQQVSGLDILLATAAINQARNSLARRSGFSPQQWVLGRSLRLPADLMDEGEVARVGALAASETPGTRFYRKSQLRFAAREAFMKTQHDDVLRRAELRRVRPTRGPFRVGDFVFYYDQADQQPGPNHWRGIARVIGHEGNSTVWITHRGMMIAVSPEHLAHANQDEVQGWLITSNETSLIDAMPAAGGAGFLDLRQRPTPPTEGFVDPENVEDEVMNPKDGNDKGEDSDDYQPSIAPAVEDENPNRLAGNAEVHDASEDLSASSTSMARMQLESERERKRELRSSEFFQNQQEKRQRLSRRKSTTTSAPPLQPIREGLDVPVGPPYDPELDDYHQAEPNLGAPLPQAPMSMDDTEAVERASKRLRVDEANAGPVSGGSEQASFCFMAYESEDFLLETSRAYYNSKRPFYEAEGIDEDVFLFGSERNDFSKNYEQLLEAAMVLQEAVPKKKGRKEIKLIQSWMNLQNNCSPRRAVQMRRNGKLG